MWGAKNTPCKIGQMFKRKGGGGQRPFEQCSKKTALFLMDGFPNSPEGISSCISSCPQCRISKVMCCRLRALVPQCRGASGPISNRILPTITHLYGNSHKGGKYRILLKFSPERLAAIHSSILTDERADSRGHMG